MHWCVLLSDIWLHSLARSPADSGLLFGAHMHPLWPGRQRWDWYLQELQQRGKHRDIYIHNISFTFVQNTCKSFLPEEGGRHSRNSELLNMTEDQLGPLQWPVPPLTSHLLVWARTKLILFPSQCSSFTMTILENDYNPCVVHSAAELIFCAFWWCISIKHSINPLNTILKVKIITLEIVYCSSNRDKRARKELSTYGPRSEDTGGTSLYFSNEQKTDTSCVKAD